MSKDLSSKWGIPDAHLLLDLAGNRRVTQKTAQLTRSGAPPPEPVSLVYRGHKSTRVKNTHMTEQMGTGLSSSDSEPATRSAGAPVVIAPQEGGEPATHNAGAPVLDNTAPDGEPATRCAGAPAVGNLRPYGEPAAPCAGAPIQVLSVVYTVDGGGCERERVPGDGESKALAGGRALNGRRTVWVLPNMAVGA